MVEAGNLSPYWGEHTARYVFALPYVADKNVIDIACGTGYGLAFLKDAARSVVGVDVSLEAAKQARGECGERVSVLLGDGTNLPFRDASFDVVTSFETLEHLHERARFLAELKRVLKPDGRLVLSTPNANYTEPVDGKPSNPFHVFEYRPEELRAELEGQFTIDRFLGQSLDESIAIPPFEDAQRRLPGDLVTRTKLYGWKAFNKIPLNLRESLSRALWKKPFYPTEHDYRFSAETTDSAPVLVAVCRK
ncbi:MAG: class I SAM-dependent methyltransferase [Acidobacteria bacterium]|nr:class I SAM-dependent methyltransferase [Acidobacteriota bacterium]